MKSKKLILILLALSLMTGIITSCGGAENASSKTNKSITYEQLEPVKSTIDSLNIMVDPRMELLSAVQLTSDYRVLTNLSFDYVESMTETFETYDKHPAVKKFRSLERGGFSYDAPPAFMLYLSNPYELQQQVELSDYIIKRGWGKGNLKDFTDKLRKFAQETDFKSFYTNNSSFYQILVNDVYDDLKDLNLSKALDDYYNMEVNSYNIILAPVFHPGGYGPRVERENGLYDVYAIIGPMNTTEGEGEYEELPEFSAESIQILVWHEFSHSFVNSATEQHSKEINQYKKLFNKIKKVMSAQAYNNWETCVNEHIVRAVTTRLAYIHQGREAGDQALANERSRGFYYIDALCESLEVYENSRETYPDFASYYPELIKVFKNLAEQDLPDSFYEIEFAGPINGAFINKDKAKIALILPTNEKEEKLEDNIKTYVQQIKKQFFKRAELIEDVKALEKDLSEYTIIAYGTMEGNKWLAEYADSFPFTVEEEKIIADEIYEDTNLRFISALPNPHNYKKPLVIYTAQKAEDVAGINNIFHGPTDYLIARKDEELSSGFYIKNKEEWTFEKE